MMSPAGTVLIQARQICVNTFLDNGDGDLLLWIDDDMVFTNEHYFHLEQELVENGLDYLSGLFFSNSMPTKVCLFGNNPEFQEWGPCEWWHVLTRYPGFEDDKDKCRFEVAATGFGMVLMTRRMLDAMRRDKNGNVIPNFQHFRLNGSGVLPHANEDIAFGMNARKAGFKLWADSRVDIGHLLKEAPVISEAQYRAQGGAEHYKLGIDEVHNGDNGSCVFGKETNVEEVPV
jgi:hypothetical protein